MRSGPLLFFLQSVLAGVLSHFVHLSGITETYEFVLAGTAGYAGASILSLILHTCCKREAREAAWARIKRKVVFLHNRGLWSWERKVTGVGLGAFLGAFAHHPWLGAGIALIVEVFFVAGMLWGARDCDPTVCPLATGKCKPGALPPCVEGCTAARADA